MAQAKNKSYEHLIIIILHRQIFNNINC